MKTGRRVCRCVCTGLALLLASCGIFVPSDLPEPPERTIAESDPFNFAGILLGAGERFVSTDPPLLFVDEFRFFEGYGARRDFTKEEVVGRLRSLVDLCDSISVKWARSTMVPEPDFRPDTVELLRRYRAYYSLRSSPSRVVDSTDGEAVLRLIKNGDRWRIHQWNDGPTLSFFHPSGTRP